KIRGIDKPSRVSYRSRADYRDRLGAFVWDLPEDLHPDVFVGQTACWWLERYNGDEPFFLQIGFPGPHPPYDPTQHYLDRYLDKPLPEPIRDYDLGAQPLPLRELRQNHYDNDHDAIVHLPNPSKEQLHRQRAHYYANVSMIDTQVGAILDALEQRGVLDNTVIVFSSDHGDCLNDHGFSQKWNMYEQSIRIPALISWPGHVAEGHRVDDPVSLMDLGPTILELAGARVPQWMEAEALCGFLNADPDAQRLRVFSEHADDKILEKTKFMTMVREHRWKLVHFVDHAEGQLFDLEADPGERVNLWNNPTCQGTKQQLLDEILKWRIESARKTQGFAQELYARGMLHTM
ncbi:MAG: sulfatase-like hydrolase/transferase, partial [Henriciella sp.]|nr:sulfatase-like hydrolase/transferase [Henriciella sp.]